MVMIIQNNIDDRIRGCLKTWFIEPKPMVFVSNINNALCQEVVQFLSKHAKKDTGFTIIKSSNNLVGFDIIEINIKPYAVSKLCNFPVIKKKN